MLTRKANLSMLREVGKAACIAPGVLTGVLLIANPAHTLPPQTRLNRIAYPVQGDCGFAWEQTCAIGIGILDPNTGTNFVIETGAIEPTSLDWLLENGIVFTAQGNSEIQVLNPSTGKITSIPGTSELDISPRWSPSGEQVAFLSLPLTDEYRSNLHIAEFSSDEVVQLTFDLSILGQLAWSPDGSQLAFTVRTNWSDFNSDEIYVVDADGSNLTRLTNNNISDFGSMWSPQGDHILYLSGDGTPYDISLFSLATNTQLQIVEGSAPRWALSGASILFTRKDDDGLPTLFALDLEGSVEQALISKPSLGLINVAPDGETVLYISREDMNAPLNLCVLNLITLDEQCFPDLPLDSSGLAVWQN